MKPDGTNPASGFRPRDAEGDQEKENYNFGRRLFLFTVVFFLGTVVTFVLWMRFVMVPAMAAGPGSGGSLVGLIPVLWIVGVIGTGIAIFSK